MAVDPMYRFMFVTTAFLCWVFYQLSGGADFEPRRRHPIEATPNSTAQQDAPRPAPASVPETVEIVSDGSDPGPTLAALAAPAALPAVRPSAENAAPETPPTPEPEDAPLTLPSESATPVAVVSPFAKYALTGPDPLASAPIAPPENQRIVTSGFTSDIMLEGNAPMANPLDLRSVRGNRVNMRAGPGVQFDVLATLSRGDEVEVLDVTANGWAKLRVLATDATGWMSLRLLTAKAAP